MTRVALVNLTPEQLELLSAMAQRPDLEVVGAVHPDSHSTPYKIAQVLAIPTGTDVETLRDRAPDLIVVPDVAHVESRRRVADVGLAAEILTTTEAASRYGITIDIHPGIAATCEPAIQAKPSPGPSPQPSRPAPSAPSTGRGSPLLEVMLRDGLDEIIAGEGELPHRLELLAQSWAQLLDAEACAIGLVRGGVLDTSDWIVAGPGAESAAAPDAIARLALGGIPQIYVRHEPATGDEDWTPSPPRALAAFPLESVPGVVWFLDLRLPAHEADERLMVLRRTARRLGRLLSLAGEVDRLKRDQAEAQRMADLAAQIADATGEEAIIATLREAIRTELHPELIVMRLPGMQDPEIVPSLPAALAGEQTILVAAEEELAASARAALKSQVKPGFIIGERRVEGLAAPIRRGHECLGTLAVFRSVPASAAAGELWSTEERRLLERLGLHAAGALALAAPQSTGIGATEGILDRRGLLALLRAEVKRSERYAVPFLLTVFELEGPVGTPPPPEELVLTFARRFHGQLRAMDAMARLGRTRFAVLNPHTDKGGGRMVLRARTVLGQLDSEQPGASSLDVRGNQIHFPADVATFDDLVARIG